MNDRDELVNSIQLKNRFIGRLNSLNFKILSYPTVENYFLAKFQICLMLNQLIRIDFFKSGCVKIKKIFLSFGPPSGRGFKSDPRWKNKFDTICSKVNNSSSSLITNESLNMTHDSVRCGYRFQQHWHLILQHFQFHTFLNVVIHLTNNLKHFAGKNHKVQSNISFVIYTDYP